MNIQHILRLRTKFFRYLRGMQEQLRGGGWLSNPCVAYGFIALSLLPFVFVVSMGVFLTNRSQIIEMQLSNLEAKARFLVKLKKDRNRFLQEFGNSDSNFLANYVETEVLLGEDIAKLEKIHQTADYAEYKPIGERISFLTGEGNQIKFQKISSSNGGYFKESHFKLEHPVEMNCDDVKKILALVEGVKIDKYLPNPMRPQLILTSFDLNLKKEDLQDKKNKIFIIDFDVMQRGYHEIPKA